MPSCVAGHCWKQASGQGRRSAPRELAFPAWLSDSVLSTSQVWGRPRPLTSSVSEAETPLFFPFSPTLGCTFDFPSPGLTVLLKLKPAFPPCGLREVRWCLLLISSVDSTSLPAPPPQKAANTLGSSIPSSPPPTLSWKAFKAAASSQRYHEWHTKHNTIHPSWSGGSAHPQPFP